MRFYGGFTQTASGTLALQYLNPVAPEVRLYVTGAAALDGALEVTVLPNLAAPGQTFTAITYGTRTASFSSNSGLQLDGGLWLRPVFNAYDLTLTVEGAPKFIAPQMTAGGFKLQWLSPPGVTCRLLASTNLADWLTLTSTNTLDGLGVYLDADSLVMPRRFYRLIPQ